MSVTLDQICRADSTELHKVLLSQGYQPSIDLDYNRFVVALLYYRAGYLKDPSYLRQRDYATVVMRLDRVLVNNVSYNFVSDTKPYAMIGNDSEDKYAYTSCQTSTAEIKQCPWKDLSNVERQAIIKHLGPIDRPEYHRSWFDEKCTMEEFNDAIFTGVNVIQMGPDSEGVSSCVHNVELFVDELQRPHIRVQLSFNTEGRLSKDEIEATVRNGANDGSIVHWYNVADEAWECASWTWLV